MTKNNYLTIAEAAAYVGMAIQTLYQLRHKGKGPKCCKLKVVGAGQGPSMRLHYLKSDLDAWDADRPRRSAPKKKTKKAHSRVKETRAQVSA